MLTRGRILAAAAVALSVAAPSGAEFYTDADRARVMARAAPNLQAVLEQDIIGNLPRDQRPLAADIRLVFPESGPNILGFYADPQTRTILFPQDSIRFFDDVATLFAWVEARECDPAAIQAYLWALLREGRDLPSPLRAFRIDRDTALADHFVDDVSAKIYSSGLQFILAHEVGHLVLGHRGRLDGADSQRQEIAADAFAMEHFARLGAMPLGVLYYFLTAWWQDPVDRADVRASTHPVSPARIVALADRMARAPMDYAFSEPDPQLGAERVQAMAAMVRQVGELAASDGMLSLLPFAMERDFPASRIATACPSG